MAFRPQYGTRTLANHGPVERSSTPNVDPFADPISSTGEPSHQPESKERSFADPVPSNDEPSHQPESKERYTQERSFDSAANFDTPQRKPLKINPIKATFNIVLAFGLIIALVVGYIVGLRVFDLTITSLGLYGLILVLDYLIQLSCAILNRWSVSRIVKKQAKAQAQAAGDCEKGTRGTDGSALLNPGGEISIAVVGYREDDKAWRECLRSLQTQTLRPKCIIGVVDGNDEPDLNMANSFIDEFQPYKAPLIHLPLLLSELSRDVYFKNIPEDTRYRLVKFWHWLTGRYRPGHVEALLLARQAVVTQTLEWNDKWNISSLDAVCFSQPHGHKRTGECYFFSLPQRSALLTFRQPCSQPLP